MERIQENCEPALCTVLFLLGTAVGSYAPILLGHGFPFWVDRNGVFFAPVFLAAGVLLRQPLHVVVAQLVEVEVAQERKGERLVAVLRPSSGSQQGARGRAE